MAEESQELVTPSSQELVVPDNVRPMIVPSEQLVRRAYAAIIDGTEPPEIGDPEITNRAILEEIVAADSFEAVFQAQSLPSWSEAYLDRDVTVLGFHLNPSSFDQGSAVYAVVEIADPEDAGELKRVTIGGQKVLVQLVKAWENKWFPCRLRLTAKDTRTDGRKVLGLEPAAPLPRATTA